MNGQHSTTSTVSVTYIHMHTQTTLRDTHIKQNTPTNEQIRLAATICQNRNFGKQLFHG